MTPHYFILQNIQYNAIAEYDIFNQNNTHSISFTPNSHYNCLAYVLGAFAWLHPIGLLSELDQETNTSVPKEMCVENVSAIISTLKIE